MPLKALALNCTLKADAAEKKLDRRDDRGARKGLCGSSGDEPSIAARVRIEKRLQF